MSVTENNKGGTQVIFDTVSNIKEINSMVDKGMSVTNLPVEKYIWHDIINNTENYSLKI